MSNKISFLKNLGSGLDLGPAHIRSVRLLLSGVLVLSILLLCGCAGAGDAPKEEAALPVSAAQGTTPAPSQEEPAHSGEETTELPILMYHHLKRDEDADGSSMSVSCFRDHMRAISEAGYHPVSLDEVLAWVEQGGELPEKPIAITFDDGYASNYELAYPVLRENDFKATIFVIGVSVGKSTYKDTDKPITPHFSMEQAEEMEASGLISIQSHGYNIHEHRSTDPEPLRRGILRREGESEEDYLAFLHEDCARMKTLLGKTPVALAYPYGVFDDISDSVLQEEGIQITLTTQQGINTLTRGDPQCLWRMNRIGCDGSMTGEMLLEKLVAAD